MQRSRSWIGGVGGVRRNGCLVSGDRLCITDDLAERENTRAQRILKKMAEKAITELPEILVPETTFYPFVLSSGGMIENSTSAPST